MDKIRPMMNIKNCIDFANEVKLCFLATNENDQPRVRALGFWYADESGFYFQTGAIKQFYGQLLKNPKTEVCFYKQNGQDKTGTTLRIAGEVEFLDDKALKEKVMAERPFLAQFGLNADSPDLIIFKIPHGQAHFWTMADNLKPKNIIEF
jgi:pyridoxamine 5'-phosphate oxidase